MIIEFRSFPFVELLFLSQLFSGSWNVKHIWKKVLIMQLLASIVHLPNFFGGAVSKTYPCPSSTPSSCHVQPDGYFSEVSSAFFHTVSVYHMFIASHSFLYKSSWPQKTVAVMFLENSWRHAMSEAVNPKILYYTDCHNTGPRAPQRAPPRNTPLLDNCSRWHYRV